MATNSASRRGASCIKCDAFQPRDGKLLRCMHLICVGCCREEIQITNTIKCLSCSAITKAVVQGEDIVDQLMSSVPYLYKASDSVAPLDDAAGSQAEKSDPCCEFCVEDDAAAATHECDGCSGALLCLKHAGQHPKKKFFAGHIVTELKSEQRADGRRRRASSSTRCFLHQNDVVMFCKTCSHSICTQCLDTGHRGHSIDNLSSVAAERLSAVRAAMGSFSESVQSASQSASQSAGSMETPIQVMLTAVSSEMDKIRQEAETASSVITDTFDRVDSIIQEKRLQLLRQVDTICWQQLEARQSKRQRLHGIEECYGTVTQLVNCMAGGDMDDADVIRFSDPILSHLTKMYSEIDSENTPLNRGKITAAPIAEALCELEKHVQSLIVVNEVAAIDVTKVSVTLPDNIHPDKEAIIRLTLPGVTTTAPPSLMAKISPPSGGSQNVCVNQESGFSSSELVMSAMFTPTEVGPHSLEIGDAAGGVKSVHFECVSAHLILDPEKCSHRITMSDNNHVATHTGDDGYHSASVAASQGYTTGRHSWNVKLHNAFAGGSVMYFGVCALPDTGNYNTTNFFFSKPFYYWCTDGYIYANGSWNRQDCREFKDGDVAMLTLDCQQKTLELHHHRTDERRVIRDVNCDKALYPALCMYCKGHQAEIF